MPDSAPSSGRGRFIWIVLAGVGLLQVGLTAAGLGGWPCPFREATGLPCPGCGLTRAVIALLRGDIADAVKQHALAPLAALAGVTLVASFFLPKALQERAIRTALALDARYRVSWVLLLLILGYWVARLALDFESAGR